MSAIKKLYMDAVERRMIETNCTEEEACEWVEGNSTEDIIEYCKNDIDNAKIIMACATEWPKAGERFILTEDEVKYIKADVESTVEYIKYKKKFEKKQKIISRIKKIFSWLPWMKKEG